MKIEEIRAISEGPKERGCRNKELCEVLSRIDEAFIYYIDREILNHSPERSALENMYDILTGECEVPGITGMPRGTEWYNSYPFGIETDVVYSRFLGICRGKTRLEAVLREAIRHSDDVVKCCPQYSERTTVIITDKWEAKTFAKYEKSFIRYAFKHGIFPIFLLVTDYGYTQIPFLTNDRDVAKELILDEDADRDEAWRLFRELPVEYIELGSAFYAFQRNEYTFYFNDGTWELKRPYAESRMIRGSMPYSASKKLFSDVLWIADADDRNLYTDARGLDAGSYSLSVFGKRLHWDASTIDENGDPRYIKLHKAIHRLIDSLEKTYL